MKKVISVVCTLLPCILFAQDIKFNVEGKIGNYNTPAKVYIEYNPKTARRELGRTRGVIDSAVLKNGKFHFTGIIGQEPVTAYLCLNVKGDGFDPRDAKLIYLEKGIVTVNGIGRMADAKVGGTKINLENERYDKTFKPLQDATKAFEDKFYSKSAMAKQSDTAFIAEREKAGSKIESLRIELNKKFTYENPDSFISLSTLLAFSYAVDYADIGPLFDSLTPAVKATADGKVMADRVARMKSVAIGARAPEFAEADTSGKIVKLSSFLGQYVLVDFWASWCGPCRAENPNVVAAYNHYKNHNFTIIGVSLDKPDAKASWIAAIHKDNLNWNQISDLKFWDNKIATVYGIYAIPQNFLIDPDGKIIAKNLRGNDLENKLEELLGNRKSGRQ